MAEVDKSKESGVDQASKSEPKKLLNGGVDPSVGKDTQFKPGQSGNPAGKPKGTKHINTWIQELIGDPDFEAQLFDLQKMSVVEFKGAPIKAIIKATITEALSARDPRVRAQAREWIAKYGWPTKNEHTGKDGERLVQTPLVISPIQPRPTDEAGDAEAQTEAS